MIEAFIVDAFTDQVFGGNPAAVCLLEGDGDGAWMQQVAAEFNLSETAFVWPKEEGFGLRWFTPAAEVDLCGHATMASAHILWQEGWAKRDEAILFPTSRYLLRCVWTEGEIAMEFPAETSQPTQAPDGLLEALGIEKAQVERNWMDLLVILDSAEEVRSIRPDFDQLREIETRGVIVTAPSDDPKWDCISRFFAVRVGVNEDPVTGSAHCCLAPYWAKRLGKSELVGYQASPRGGEVAMQMTEQGVTLAGQAVTFLKGELCANER